MPPVPLEALQPAEGRPKGVGSAPAETAVAGATRGAAALRWVLCLPIALSGAWAARTALKVIVTFGPDDMLAANAFVSHLRVTTVSDGAMGVAFVYLGALVAPAHRRRVGSILGVLALLVSGAAVLARLLQHDSWAAFAAACTAVGAGGTAYAIHVGRIGLDGGVPRSIFSASRSGR